ncbi:probable protein disulfide-isomerase ER-60 [Anthonomus grandis grandis]|uniref:probable protein disulfide-isomerase ER-60 n=1 Tax=Anthonomus grandis grandis TaxID=2921223 RepID=UPI0021662561|nr:probable protein disulfide-isomerase ER-60 [Anthonomus grandis grandis]
MRKFCFIIIILSILFKCLTTLVAIAEKYDPFVLYPTTKDFEKILMEYRLGLVLFDVPWCQKCHEFRPYFKKAAAELNKRESFAVLVHLECYEDSRNICLKYSVKEYPKLKIFRYGQYVHDYKGEWNYVAIMEYMLSLTETPCQEVVTLNELNQLLSQPKIPIIIGYFAKVTDLKFIFFEVAYMFTNIKFAHSHSKDILNKIGSNESIVLYQAHHLKTILEPTSKIYIGEANINDLVYFIYTNMYGLVGIRTLENQQDFKYPLVVVYYEINYDINPKQTVYWRNRVIQVAYIFSGFIHFAISSRYNFSHEIPSKNYHLFNYPYVAIIMDESGQKIAMTEKFSVDNLIKFVQRFLSSPFPKSLITPKEQNGPVIEIVSRNFETFLSRNKKNIFLAFYDRNSKIWKDIEPIYEELAWRLVNEEVYFAKMDAVNNYVPVTYKIDKLPTLYWIHDDWRFPPIQYKGKIDFNSIIKFIAGLTSFEMNGWDRNGNVRKRLEL